jgi:hypothetical protein
MERSQKRNAVDVEYLKNVMVKYLELQDNEVRTHSLVTNILETTACISKDLSVFPRGSENSRAEN